MKAIKAVILIVLSLLLFLCLTVFGIGFTANATLLSRDFLPREVDRLEMAPLLTDAVELGAPDAPANIRNAAAQAAAKLEPEVKAQFKAANYKVYAYLLGQSDTIDLSQVIKDTVLSSGLISSIENDADVLTLVRQTVRNELAKMVPASQQQLTSYLDQAMPSLDPWLRQQMDAATGPVVDYLVGNTNTLHMTIALDQMKSILQTSARAAFLKSPPSQLAGATQAQLDAIFGQYYSQFAAQIPASITIDPSSLGLSGSSSMAQTLSDAESGLSDAKAAISRFRTYFLLLLLGIALLIAAIILVHREVKGSMRDLGIVFLTYGFLESIGILIGEYFLGRARISGAPEAIQSWLPGVYWDILRPLLILSIVLAIVGLGMIIVSVVYRRRATA